MKDRYRAMMEQFQLSDEARQAIEQKLNEKTAVRKNLPLRAALIAACICLVLMGGVFAAGKIAKVLMSDPQSGKEHSGYEVIVDLPQEDEKTFSKALASDLENGTLHRAFMTRSELEEYIGFSLIHSELLESAPINDHLEQAFQFNWDLRPELKVAPDARYVLTAQAYDGTEMTGFPEVLKITMHRIVENYEIYIDARIITGSGEGEINLVGEEFNAEPLVSTRMIVDENGNILFDENGDPRRETIYYQSAEKIFTSESYVMDNGIEATIVTAETRELYVQSVEDPDFSSSGKGFCEYIAYFVHDGILYSIRPGGIYDNSVEENYVNGMELIVLKHILDSFMQ